MRAILWDPRLPLELCCIRQCAAVETQQERQALRHAWRKCLINGPSVLRAKPTPKRRTAPIPNSAELERIKDLQRAMELA